MTSEHWRAVDPAGWYEVSDHGRVRSWVGWNGGNRWGQPAERRRANAPRVLRVDHPKGYARVELPLDGIPRKHLVSRLMLAAFVGPPPSPDHEAAHNDGNPRNNVLGNLRWATPAENARDKERHGTSPKGEGNGHRKLTWPDVHCIRELADGGMPHRGLGAMYGVTPQNIRLIASRKTWNHNTRETH